MPGLLRTRQSRRSARVRVSWDGGGVSGARCGVRDVFCVLFGVWCVVCGVWWVVEE